MAWTAMPTIVGGQALPASFLNILVGNLNETAAAKASSAGQYFVATAANTLVARTPSTSFVDSAEGTTATNTAWTDLATVGPRLTVSTGARALVAFGCQIENSLADFGGTMSYSMVGPTTPAAMTSLGSLRLMSNQASPSTASRQTASRVNFETGLGTGLNTFTAKYVATNGGTATFTDRSLTVLPF